MSELRPRHKKIILRDENEHDDIIDRSPARGNFTLLDVIRILGGILLLNFLLSYYITKTPLWGTKTKLTNPRYLEFTFKAHVWPGSGYLNLTEDELSRYNGEDRALPIYVAINGSVYDVTSNPDSYGPLGAYSFFSGRDAARAYSTGCFHQDLTHDLRGLDPIKVEKDISGWKRFYESSDRYWFVGYVHHPPLTGPIPDPCNAAQKPS
ncbi:hypothetical protein AWJ20_1835 [Sugiyamaella lignohabitans]|uniref:Cytochrome b5 heme-binding domain-containing protein n=1 Tax=Sugiyamaella lignohabitans TaxID=796027 RepID=A0A167E1M5_9ASCO|nr:uncharacterized protein AWJ20_1835 [Sugiyamaella lignohabitans]ANB13539.1 hypothetical protein AWJ20_1835 [Sugiyamaella lignohabitans]